MSDEQIRINTRDRLDDQMIDIDLITSDGRSNHYAIASVVVRMDGMVNDSPDLFSFAERLVSRYNACAGMIDPAAEIAELKRQRDSLQLEAINCHEMLCVKIEMVTNLIAELGFVSEYATRSVIGFCKGDEKSIFDFSKFMEGIFNRYDIELSTECKELLNEGKFTKPKPNLN